MLVITWLAATFRRTSGRTVLCVFTVAIAVALLGSIGAFLAGSKATMTTRAIDRVAVDWQVQVAASADTTSVTKTVAAFRNIVAIESIEFGQSPGLSSTVGGTTQTTGTAVVLGVPNNYSQTFPGQFRQLTGTSGVVLAQQTAANLHAGVGDQVMIQRGGLPPVTVTVDGVVELPEADSLFQMVGAPVGAQAQAAPDNVLLLGSAEWHQMFDPVAAIDPAQVHSQIHARISHALPADPAAAFDHVSGEARNLEVTLAGGGLVGSNLGATLGAARADALYSQVLFLFLGLPGIILAAFLTSTVADSGAQRRRSDQALLRARGATSRLVTRLGLSEALAIGITGSTLGLGSAAAIGKVVFGSTGFGAGTAAALWMGAAVLVGVLIATGTMGFRAVRDAKTRTVAASRLLATEVRPPWWYRFYLDVTMIAIGGVIFWLTSRAGYHLVLAVEGLPQLSVSYWAFAGPALIWIGFTLLTWRLTYFLLGRGQRAIAAAARPLAGNLSATVAMSLQPQRRILARGAALVAATIAFAASTAVFNSTYHQQADVDALLSNGADVTVTASPGATPSSGTATRIAQVPGVRSVEPIQHRYAYVGADLQDLYGVQPETILAATKLQDPYFTGGTAAELMARLAAQPDSILVSAETVHDFQLHLGDHLTLRLQDGRTKQYKNVGFIYSGIAREFPTAPRDSFLVANASYVASQTGIAATGAYLADTGGTNVSRVAESLRSSLGTEFQVTDIASSRRIIGSSLTAVDLAGLTRVELGFALLLASASTGLVLWLGLAERRRTWAITTALGATPRQLAAFIRVEGLIVIGCGLLAGVFGGAALSLTLVKVLSGVFDPAPSTLAIPWAYLVAVAIIVLGATLIAIGAAVRSARRPSPQLLRSL